jgi:hypothetical protein
MGLFDQIGLRSPWLARSYARRAVCVKFCGSDLAIYTQGGSFLGRWNAEYPAMASGEPGSRGECRASRHGSRFRHDRIVDAEASQGGVVNHGFD